MTPRKYDLSNRADRNQIIRAGRYGWNFKSTVPERYSKEERALWLYGYQGGNEERDDES